MNTFTVSTAVTPTVVSTFLSHYLNRKPLRERPTAHLSYDEGLHLIRSFMTFASQHTVEDLQAFTSQWVPHPQWVRVDMVDIPEPKLEEAADLLQKQLGPDGIRKVGGRKWWQWRKPSKPLRAEWIEMKSDYNERKRSAAPETSSKRVMLYVHGGAYFFGSVDEHRYQMQRHARKLKARVFAPAYRLSPQFPFPCGLQDCLAAYLHLLTVQDPNTIILAGDSAGGGMVMSMLVTLRDRGIPMPAGAILISPWVDLTHSFPSVSQDCPLDYIPACGFHHKPSKAWPPLNHEELALLNEQVAKRAKLGHTKLMKPDSVEMKRLSQNLPQGTGDSANGQSGIEPLPAYLSVNIDGQEVKIKDQIQMYAPNELLSHPLVSPVLQPTLGGLPPLLIMVGGGEFLRDEQIYLAHKCANPSKYQLPESLMHEDAREQLARFKPTDVQLQVWDDLCHVAPTLSFTRPAKFMYRSIAQFGAWALARAQHVEIEILDDDDISVISNSDEEDGEAPNGGLKTMSPEPSADHGEVGRAGDPLPPFRNHMIRQRISRHGVVSPLDPSSSLPGCTMDPESIGVIKEGPVRKWLEARRQWGNRFGSAYAKVHKQRIKEMIDGYVPLEGESPPPSALAGRRRAEAESRSANKKTQSRKKSVGLALWSLWGSKHDEATIEREQGAEKEPDTKAATVDEGQGARSAGDLKAQTGKVARGIMGAGTRSRSKRKIVRDEHQTENSVDENTPAAELIAKKEAAAQHQPEGSEESGLEKADNDTLEPVTGVTGKRPILGGIALPFSLNREASTASMITLKSMAGTPGSGPGSRVASPPPAGANHSRTPTSSSGLRVEALSVEDTPSVTVTPSDEVPGDEDEGAITPKTSAVSSAPPPDVLSKKVAAVLGEGQDADANGSAGLHGPGTDTPERPPLESFVTAEEDLPRLSS